LADHAGDVAQVSIHGRIALLCFAAALIVCLAAKFGGG
jgi:hypothetical protein